MKIDMHVHSRNSKDCNLTIDEIINRARRKKLAGIAITDHNKITFSKIIEKQGIFIIPGCEIKTNKGEVLAYFVKEMPKNNEFFSTIDFLKKQNAMISIPHPFDLLRKEAIHSENLLNQIKDKIDFIELNARSLPIFINKAEKFAKKNNIKLIAGSDAHLINEIGDTYTIINNLKNLEVLGFKIKKSYFSLLNLIRTKLKKLNLEKR